MTRPPGEPRRVAYLYLLPGLALFAVFVLTPLARAGWISLFEWDGVTTGTWVGLDNYQAVFTEADLRRAFWHSAVLLVFYAVLPVAIGLLLAGAASRTRVRGLTALRTIIFLPQVIALVVVAVTWRLIYQPTGWLGDFGLALPAVGLIGTWVAYGLCFVLFMAGVQKVPRSLYDAARVDGAGAVREFFAVTVPALRGEIAVALTLTTIAGLRNFDVVYLTTAGGPGDATSVPALEVYERAFRVGEVGSAAAVGVCLAAVIFALSLAINQVADRAART
ncbi:MAG TPA: sugar ABC transporter permease [Solirubrobacteraceae bacterium]|nr:sugar ABC transporter permease [Solirubrobacteraceae bacterium]